MRLICENDNKELNRIQRGKQETERLTSKEYSDLVTTAFLGLASLRND